MLEALADDVYLWPGSGHLSGPNAGVIVEDDGLTVIDSLLCPSQARDLLAALEAFDRPVKRLILTSSHVTSVGGSNEFKLAAVYGSSATSANLDLPPNIAGYQHLFPEYATEFTELRTRTVSHLVQEAAWLTPKVVAAPLSGHQSTNLAVQVPHANVVFAGALCSFGAHPLGFEADFAAWLDSVAQLAEWGTTVVPGVGPAGTAAELGDFAAYLAACVDAGAAGVPLPEGPWDEWADEALRSVNEEHSAALARGDLAPQPSALRLFGLA